MRGLLGITLALVVAGGSYLTFTGFDGFGADQAADKNAAIYHAIQTDVPQFDDNQWIRRLGNFLHADATGKVPGKLPEGGGMAYRGNDTCQWANDGECDDPGIGTGACTQEIGRAHV